MCLKPEPKFNFDFHNKNNDNLKGTLVLQQSGLLTNKTIYYTLSVDTYLLIKRIMKLRSRNDETTYTRVQESCKQPVAYNRRPRRPPFLLVESDGIGVTSSIRPILIPERANARSAD